MRARRRNPRTHPRTHRAQEALPPRPTLPHGLTRQACTCAPESSNRLSAHACPACQAWTHNTVLLADGRTIPNAAWLDALKPPPGEAL
jgi:hypothetical protein